MPEVTLIPLAEDERRTLLQEEVADYADQQVRDAGWPPAQALDRAQAEIAPVFDRELAEAMASDDRLWSAKSADGQSVGWLWVKKAARSLYAAAGYEEVSRDERRVRLRKVLHPSDTLSR